MSKSTPGPWSRVPQSEGGDLIAREIETGKQMNPKGLRLIAFMMSRGNSLPEDEANARLITAAPELLEALRSFISLDKTFASTPEHCMQNMAEGNPLVAAVLRARAAIQKAEGA